MSPLQRPAEPSLHIGTRPVARTRQGMGTPGSRQAGAVMPRCCCRPGCLTFLRASDDILVTTDGAVLRVHVEEVEAFPQPSLFEMAETVHHSGSAWAR